jgi:hypothetical protein
VGVAQRGHPVALRERLVTAVISHPGRQAAQLGGQAVQSLADGVGVGAVLEQLDHQPQVLLNHRQQLTAAQLVIGATQPACDLGEVVKHSSLLLPTATAR